MPAEHPQITYEKSRPTLAGRQEWAQAVEGWAQQELVDFAIDLLGFAPDCDPWPFENIGVDPLDWAGVSIEFHRAEPTLTLSVEQVQRIEDAGFDVARVMFKESLPRADYHTQKSLARIKALREVSDADV